MNDKAGHAERRALNEARGFDADDWGASPSWDPSAEQSLYDDDDVDDELVPRARSLFGVPDPGF
jgi:hypothetical protein